MGRDKGAPSVPVGHSTPLANDFNKRNSQSSGVEGREKEKNSSVNQISLARGSS